MDNDFLEADVNEVRCSERGCHSTLVGRSSETMALVIATYAGWRRANDLIHMGVLPRLRCPVCLSKQRFLSRMGHVWT